MVTLAPLQIQGILASLTDFRLGDPMRFVEPKRSRDEFVEYGWKRAADAAGLTVSQRFDLSCLFVAERSSFVSAVGFYLRPSLEVSEGRLFLARPLPGPASAMRLHRLLPDLGPDFPGETPLLLSLCIAASNDPVFPLYALSGGFWCPIVSE